MFCRFHALGLITLAIGILFSNDPLAADLISTQTSNGLITYDVDTEGPRAGGDYYGSGNDDAFGEYGITTFNYSQADFGGPVMDLFEIELMLTVNGRSFGDGGLVEFFFTPDSGTDLDVGGGDFSALVFDHDFDNGINPDQFLTAPVSLGAFHVAPTTDDRAGQQDVFTLTFEGSALMDLINSINNGTDFQIIIAAGNQTSDVTYSGVGNNFDPGDPQLSISGSAVPEPTAVISLAMLSLAVVARRRRG